jgi:hypothetical protein
LLSDTAQTLGVGTNPLEVFLGQSFGTIGLDVTVIF